MAVVMRLQIDIHRTTALQLEVNPHSGTGLLNWHPVRTVE